MSTALKSALTHPPKIIHCEICGGYRICIRTDPHPLPGTRCISCRGTAKHRGLYAALQQLRGKNLEALAGQSVWEMSAHGAFYEALKRQSEVIGFKLVATEYYDGVPSGTIHNGVRCENVEAASFPDESFNLITCTDVFEHVENELKGFSEIARLLKPGGILAFTVPYENAPTLERARRRADATIEHLAPPEYHGDPFRGKAGVFTWRTYGPDIVARTAPLKSQVRPMIVSGTSTPSPVVIAVR